MIQMNKKLGEKLTGSEKADGVVTKKMERGVLLRLFLCPANAGKNVCPIIILNKTLGSPPRTRGKKCAFGIIGKLLLPYKGCPDYRLGHPR